MGWFSRRKHKTEAVCEVRICPRCMRPAALLRDKPKDICLECWRELKPEREKAAKMKSEDRRIVMVIVGVILTLLILIGGAVGGCHVNHKGETLRAAERAKRCEHILRTCQKVDPRLTVTCHDAITACADAVPDGVK